MLAAKFFACHRVQQNYELPPIIAAAFCVGALAAAVAARGGQGKKSFVGARVGSAQNASDLYVHNGERKKVMDGACTCALAVLYDSVLKLLLLLLC